MISVGRKCFFAKVLLPEPEAPIRTTRDSSGNVNFSLISLIRLKDGRWPFALGHPVQYLLPQREETKPYSCDTKRRERPRTEIRRESTRNDGLCDEERQQAWSRISRCIHGWAWS